MGCFHIAASPVPKLTEMCGIDIMSLGSRKETTLPVWLRPCGQVSANAAQCDPRGCRGGRKSRVNGGEDDGDVKRPEGQGGAQCGRLRPSGVR